MDEIRAKFYSQLESAYLGVKIADFHRENVAKSGWTNLLDIKNKYFQHIKSVLKREIDDKFDTDEKKDIYNKLFTFFGSYLNDTGTPFFTDTPSHKNIYAKIGTKDTSLFYKTQNLYYVKSDTLYESLTVLDKSGKFAFIFDASEYAPSADNAKNKVIFKLQSIAKAENAENLADLSKENAANLAQISQNSSKNAENLADSSKENALNSAEISHFITIKVSNNKEFTSIFKQNVAEFQPDFLKTLKNDGVNLSEDELKRIFAAYKKQNEVDFFIHKDAAGFLKEQFDLWFFRYVFKDEVTQWSLETIKKLRNLRKVAFEVIALIAKFENELKAIWEKPKFAKKVNFVLSLSVILQNAKNAKAVLKSILKSEDFKAQLKEWRDLELISDEFKLENLREFIENSQNDENSQQENSLFNELNSKGKKGAKIPQEDFAFLPIDTKHLSKELKFELLGAFEDLESLLNGELIKADNFQALNSIMPKYQGRIDLIYIDPPYNTGNDGFIYADNFNHSSWLSMAENRLNFAKNFLNNQGSIFISIDDNEQANLKLLCNGIFGEENFVAQIIWRKIEENASSGGTMKQTKTFRKDHEYILCYSKTQGAFLTKKYIELPNFEGNYKNLDNDPRGEFKAGSISMKGNKNSAKYYEITTPSGKKYARVWRITKDEFDTLDKDNRIYYGKNKDAVPQIKIFLNEERPVTPKTIFENLGSAYEAGENLKELLGISAENKTLFENPKPVELIKRILEVSTNTHTREMNFVRELDSTNLTPPPCHIERSEISLNRDSSLSAKAQNDKFEGDIILDFFAGSGTTAQAVMELNAEDGGNRKFIGVEMGEHFYSVIIPRIKKVAFSSEWKDGKLKDNKQVNPSSIAFIYYELESYEEALSECEYILEDGVIDYKKSRKLIKTLKKAPNEPICLDMSDIYYKNFDIFQTMSNLMGWKIKRRFLKDNKESCEFENGLILREDEANLAKFDKLKTLIWWR